MGERVSAVIGSANSFHVPVRNYIRKWESRPEEFTIGRKERFGEMKLAILFKDIRMSIACSVGPKEAANGIK